MKDKNEFFLKVIEFARQADLDYPNDIVLNDFKSWENQLIRIWRNIQRKPSGFLHLETQGFIGR